jgi:hypothetical protein
MERYSDMPPKLGNILGPLHDRGRKMPGALDPLKGCVFAVWGLGEVGI